LPVNLIVHIVPMTSLWRQLILHFFWLSPVAATRYAVHVEEKVQVVPALLTRGLRIAMQNAKKVEASAEVLEAQWVTMREKAAVQKQKAETRNKAMEALVNKTLQKQERLLAKQKEVAQLMVNHNESQYEWRTNNSELEKMQKNLTAENRLYEELKKKVEQQIVNLTDMQEQAYQRLGMLQNAVEKKQDEVLTLKDKAENHGSIARNASRAADEVQADLAEVQDLWSKQKISAEEAEKEFLDAKMDADAANKTHFDLRREANKSAEVKDLVLGTRDALQSFYNKMNDLTKSIEDRMAQDSTKAAPQLLREDPNTKRAMESYNEMVDAFRNLYHKVQGYVHVCRWKHP